MADQEPVISIVIPVAAAGAFTHECLQSVLNSVADFDGRSQIILVLNGLEHGEQESLAALLARPNVMSVQRPERIGSAPARCLGIGLARGRYVLLTDADCLVPPDWVAEMAKAAASYGVASGQVQSANGVPNTYVRVQQEMDRVRNSVVTRLGTRRYPTVSNMAARREHLTHLIDDPHNAAEDIQLSLEFLSRGLKVGSVDHIVVRTVYPSSFRESLSRQAKHAMGAAFAQRQWSRRQWRSLGMAGPLALAATALIRIWRLRLSHRERTIALALRLCFAAQWAFCLAMLMPCKYVRQRGPEVRPQQQEPSRRRPCDTSLHEKQRAEGPEGENKI